MLFLCPFLINMKISDLIDSDLNLIWIFENFQAALEAPRVLNLNSNKYFSGPYGMDLSMFLKHEIF